jgi:hypothetical protein
VEDLFLADNHLGDTGRVTQIDEGHATVISAAAYPASQGDGLSNVLGTQGSEVMCAQHSIPFNMIFRTMTKRSRSSLPV